MKMETIEGNKLIYAFMEGKWVPMERVTSSGQTSYSEPEYDSFDECQKACNAINATKKGSPKVINYASPYPSKKGINPILQYHSSWDRLMPVYQKIANVWFNLSPKKQKEIKDIKEALQNRLVLAELNSVWEFIVHFIQWYNTTNPQPNATK